MPQLKSLSPMNQTAVLKLHHDIFSDSACKTCKGSCCVSCGASQGYLSFLPSKQFKELAEKYGFDKKKGFQTETGCALPMTERSDVCLSFMCTGDTKTWAQGHGPAKTKLFTDEDRTMGKQMSAIFWPQREYRVNNPVIPAGTEVSTKRG